MPALKLRVADAARQDLQEIWDYLSLYNEAIADRTVEKIAAVYETLKDFPLKGRSRDELKTGLRSLVSDNYLIYYHIETNTIFVDRILHGARDVSSIFNPTDGEREQN